MGPKERAGERGAGALAATVNVLSVSSFVIGIFAIFSTWYLWTNTGTGDVFLSRSLFERVRDMSSVGLDELGLLLIIIGAVCTFVSPLGGFVEALGIGAFYYDYQGVSSNIANHFDGYKSAELGVGFYLGVASAAVAIVAVLFPAGPGFGSFKPSRRQRILTFALNSKDGGSARLLTRPRMQNMLSAARRERAWVFSVLSVLLLSSLVALVDQKSSEEAPILVPVGAGVMFEFEKTYVGRYGSYRGSWDNMSLTLQDGSQTVNWKLSSSLLSGGSYCSYDNGTKTIGALTVRLVLIDELGDGVIGRGDKFVLTPEDGSTFVLDHEYSIRFGVGRYILYGAGTSLTFVHHGTYVEASYTDPEWRIFM